MNAWRAWLDARGDAPESVADVRKEHVVAFIESRHEIEAPGTVLSRYRHLRTFFKWCEREEIIDRNPMRTISEPIAPEQPPEVLSSEQLRSIFERTHADKSTLGRRDYALLLLLADSGMRVGELVGMEIGDVDFDYGSVEVVGKGRRRKRAPFNAHRQSATRVPPRAVDGAVGTDRVWIGQRGPLAEAAVWGIVKQRGEDAGVKGVFPHLFRHTMAHHFRFSGGAEGDLAAIGGWRSPKMMARYGASAASERALAAHRRVDHLGDVFGR